MSFLSGSFRVFSVFGVGQFVFGIVKCVVSFYSVWSSEFQRSVGWCLSSVLDNSEVISLNGFCPLLSSWHISMYLDCPTCFKLCSWFVALLCILFTLFASIWWFLLTYLQVLNLSSAVHGATKSIQWVISSIIFTIF